MTEPTTITQSRLCELVGYDERNLRRIAERGYIPAVKDGAYSLEEVLAGLFRWLREKNEGGNSELAAVKLKRQREKLRKDKVEADLAEGAAIKVDDVRRVMVRTITAAKTKLLAVPASVAPRLPGKDVIEMETIIGNAIRDALREAAAHPWAKEDK